MPSHPGVPFSGRFRQVAAVSLVVALLFTAACSSDDDGAGTGGKVENENERDNATVLGTKKPAAGEPVKLGFLSDGRGPAIDNTYQAVAADGIVQYINDYLGGIAGRPIELEKCETKFDPGKATECGDEFVEKGVVGVLMPETSAALPVFEVMKANKIPLFSYGVGDSALLLDNSVMFSLVDPIGGLADGPISIAEDNDLDKVTIVVVDVPAATTFYSTIAPAMFEEAGIELEVIAIPPDQADMTPQMTEIANGDPTAVHIVGQDTFCISGINGLFAAGFDGPISMLSGSCDRESVKTALEEKLEGVYVSSATATGDIEDPGIELWNAIVDEYDVDVEPAQGMTTFITVLAFRRALEKLTGDVTPETILSTIRSMEPTPLPGGGGLNFRCSGKARELLPAVCSSGNLRSQLDDTGETTLPWTLVGNDPIPA
jgi:branched-chain amino acid transport system substrate-binding protein